MTKFDSAKPLFVGSAPARAGSVFDEIRKTVRDLDSGAGVAYSDLEAAFIANFKARSAKSVDSAYVRSYVRDAVNKYSHLSQETASEYTVTEVAAKEPKAPSTPKASPVNDEVVSFIRERGEVNTVEEIDLSQISVQTIVEETKRKTKTIMAAIEAMEAEGLVRTEQVDDSVYVYLTEAGFNRAEAAATAPAETAEVEAEQGEESSPAAQPEETAEQTEEVAEEIQA